MSKFSNAFKERVDALPDKQQQQQFIEGVVFALDAMLRYGYLAFPEFTPFQREMLIGSAIAHSYSDAYHRGLDAKTNMKKLVESIDKERALSAVGAATFQEAADVPLSKEEASKLDQYIRMTCYQ